MGIRWRGWNHRRRTSARPSFLTTDQYEALLTAAVDRPTLHTYILTLGESGVRSESEALHLQWPNVDLEQGFLWIESNREHRTKAGKGRWVPMTARLREALTEHVRRYQEADYDAARPTYASNQALCKLNRRAQIRARNERASH